MYRKKNILVVTPFYHPENFKINEFVKYLSKKDKVTVLCPIPNYPKGNFFKGYNFFKKRIEKKDNLTIYRILVWPRKNGSKINLFLNYLTFIIFSILPSILLSFKKFDLIFINQVSPITVSIPAIIIKKIRKTPIIMWVMDLWPESVKDGGNLKSNFIPNLLLPIVRYIYRNCDKILISSRAFSTSIEEKVENKNLIYVPQWGETEFSSANITKFKNSKIEEINDCIILFAGNIGFSQDFNTLLLAMNEIKLKPIHLAILGDGRDKKNIIKKIKKLKLESKISFLGQYPVDKMPYFFEKSSALLISLKKSEIFSRTVPSKTQSYMAFGKPILTNADGEVSKIISEAKCGLTSNSGDYKQLAQNMVKISLSQKKDLDLMASNAKKYYDNNFNREKIFTNLDQLFEKVINDKK